MEEESIETQMLMLESLAETIMEVAEKEKHDENLLKFPCMRILLNYYTTDRNKYDTVIKIIQERRKNDERVRK